MHSKLTRLQTVNLKCVFGNDSLHREMLRDMFKENFHVNICMNRLIKLHDRLQCPLKRICTAK